MNEFPRMLYKAGGPEEIHGGRFSTLIVHNDDDLDAALAGGWSMTTPEAIEAAKPPAVQGATATSLSLAAQDNPDTAAPTRSELEQKATELGITFGNRLGDAKLAALIDEALKA